MKALTVTTSLIAITLAGSFIAGIALKAHYLPTHVPNPSHQSPSEKAWPPHSSHLSTAAINGSLLLGTPYAVQPAKAPVSAPTGPDSTPRLEQIDNMTASLAPAGTESTLESLLMAEFEVKRNAPEQAIERYLAAARQLHDPTMAERAADIAWTTGTGSATRIATTWKKLASPHRSPSIPIIGARMNAAVSHQEWLDALRQALLLASRGQVPDMINLVSQAADNQGPLSDMQALLLQYNRHHQDQPLPRMALAIAQARDNQPGKASATIAQVKKGWPDLAIAWLVNAQIALINNHPEHALQQLAHGHRMEPGNPRFLLARTQVLLQLERWQQAHDQAIALIRSLPDDQHDDDTSSLVNASANLFLVYHHPEITIELLSPLVDSPLADADTRLLLATAYQERHQWQQAVSCYLSIDADNPAYINGVTTAAELILEHKGSQPALDMLARQRREHSRQLLPLMNLSLAVMDHVHRSTDADALLDNSIESSAPDNNELLLMRVYRRIDQRAIKDAEADLATLLQRLPDNPEVLNAYGYTLSEFTQRYQEALHMLEKAHLLAPGDSAIQDSLGITYARMGQLDKALPLLTSADHAAPNDEVSAHLAHVLMKLGQPRQARQLVQKRIKQLQEHPKLDRMANRYGWSASHHRSHAPSAKGAASR